MSYRLGEIHQNQNVMGNDHYIIVFYDFMTGVAIAAALSTRTPKYLNVSKILTC